MKDIGDYDISSVNIDNEKGRGIIIYTHSILEAKEFEMSTDFDENIFLRISLNDTDTLLLGAIYRSDSGSSENNTSLRNLLKESTEKSFTHVLIMGDFNYPNIDWKTWNT